MSEILSIGASRSLDVLKHRLAREIQALAGEGWRLGTRQLHLNGVHQLSCHVESCPLGESPEEMALILRQYVARLLTEWILEDWEQDLLLKHITTNYYYFSDSEKKAISDKALQIIQQEEETSKEYIIYQVGRNQRILERLLEVILNHGHVHMDGFIRFRMQDYLKHLGEAADAAVEEFMMEKEYNEFIRLLRYFLEIQESRLPVVHVFLRAGGHFQLFDDRGRPVTNEIVEGFTKDLVDNDISYEDLLISALITIAPEQVVIHFFEGAKGGEAMNTIYAVFGDRMHRCPGCERCLASLSETSNI